VTPFGDIIPCPERGTFLGNRGVLHDTDGRIKRPWQVKRWLVCALEFRNRRRTVMAPNRYTHLFFLDEATALAAGHRPCAECRRARFIHFCHAWKRFNSWSGQSPRPSADEMDARLHVERIARDRSKRSFTGALDELPDGVFVVNEEWGEQAYLVWRDRLLAWSAGGYRTWRRRPKNALVRVLTPRSTVKAIRAGYVPEVHASAGSSQRSRPANR
jgi:hypothetical protein